MRKGPDGGAPDMRLSRVKMQRIYRRLEKKFGNMGWWPAESAFEVIVGAVLTQNTAWKNVETAIVRLKEKGMMSPDGILTASDDDLETALMPSGYYRVKAARLRCVCDFLISKCDGDVGRLKKEEIPELRRQLLGIKGVGPETADSILLYALEMPVFVVDSYTRRVFSRHGIISGGVPYEEIRRNVETCMKGDTRALNQLHAFIVEVCKRFCRKTRTLCRECPLEGV